MYNKVTKLFTIRLNWSLFRSIYTIFIFSRFPVLYSYTITWFTSNQQSYIKWHMKCILLFFNVYFDYVYQTHRLPRKNGIFWNEMYEFFDGMCNNVVNFLTTMPPISTPSRGLPRISWRKNVSQFAMVLPPPCATTNENVRIMQMRPNQCHHWWYI